MLMIRSGIIIITSFILYSSGIFCQSSSSIRVLFYNVENAFDVFDDSLTDDSEFLPGGVRRWTKSRYDDKINSIYKAIIASGGWSPPEIIAFCEVENKKVIDDLLKKTYLSKYSYDIIHEDSPDSRGIDVCLIYRKDYVKLDSYCYLKPSGTFYSRPVLSAKFISKPDTLNLFVNHWPSRRGGVLAGSDLRLRLAAMVKAKADSILECSPDQGIIIVGDFNSNPTDPEMMTFKERSLNRKKYINLCEKFYPLKGTYRYQGKWEMFDQVIVSENLMRKGSTFLSVFASFKIVEEGFLLKDDPVYPGKSPFSTYRGLKYQGGFSDHLPVLLSLERE